MTTKPIARPLRLLTLVSLLPLAFLFSACGSPLSGDDPGATMSTSALQTEELSTYSVIEVLPKTAVVSMGGVQAIAVAGGKPPYTFSILSGVGQVSPNGSSAGIFVAGTTPGTVMVGIADSTGTTTVASYLVSPPTSATSSP